MPRKTLKTKIKHTSSSGNVFHDLGLADADDMLAKSELTILINRILVERKLTRAEGAKLMGVDQADASRLFNNRLTRFSIDRLFTILNNLGYVIEIRVKEAKEINTKSGTQPKSKSLHHIPNIRVRNYFKTPQESFKSRNMECGDLSPL